MCPESDPNPMVTVLNQDGMCLSLYTAHLHANSYFCLQETSSVSLPQDKIGLYKDHALFKHLLNQEGDSTNPDVITIYTLLKVRAGIHVYGMGVEFAGWCDALID